MTSSTLGHSDQILLEATWPLPHDRPFTLRQAIECGVGRKVLRRLEKDGFVRRVRRGVYVAADVADDQILRTRALALVVPSSAVVTDLTAAWAHGVDVRPPAAHPNDRDIDMFLLPGGTRVRSEGCNGGERTLLPQDVMRVGGVSMTVALRTALDLGRLLPRDRAIGALDGLLRLGDFTHDELLSQVERFKGMRGVVQLRELAPVADARSESPAESVLRLRWLDTSLPRPTPQISFVDASGSEIYRLDLGIPELRYGAEYNGVAWHSTPEAKALHEKKLEWLGRRGWTVDVFEKKNVFGNDQDAAAVLRRGVARARGQLSKPSQDRARRLRWPQLTGQRDLGGPR